MLRNLLLLLFLPLYLSAQDTLVLTPAMAVTLALEKNPALAGSAIMVENALAGMKAVPDISPLEVTYRSGQLYSDENSVYLRINQNFGSLPEHINNYRLAESELNKDLAGHELRKKETAASVKSAYYYWVYQNNRLKLLSAKQRVFSGLPRFAEMKYDSGRLSPDSLFELQSMAADAETRLAMCLADVEISANKIRMFLMSNEELVPSMASLPLYQVDRPSDTAMYTANTLINYYRKLLEVSSASVRLKKAAFFPGVSLGVINQRIKPYEGLWAWQLGITFPLFFMEQKAGIRQAGNMETIAYLELENRIFRTEKEIENLLMELEKIFRKIMYFNRYLLVQAENSEENAKVQLENEEISYLDYIKIFDASTGVKMQYLEAVDQYNQIAIQLEFYMD